MMKNANLARSPAKVEITSLNSHSGGIYSGTRYGCASMLYKFWQCVPTNRTHFLSWLNHQIGLALGAFDRVEFDSFDTLAFWDATHFALLPLRQRCIVGLREP